MRRTLRMLAVGAVILAGAGRASAQHDLPTEVWLQPAPAGDMLEMFRHPEQWERARAQTDVIGFYSVSAFDFPADPGGYDCGVPCGPNSLANFRAADVFRTVTQVWGKKIAIEAGAVKAHSCDDIRKEAIPALIVLDNITAAGGRADYIAIDESFAAGTNPVDTPGFGGCGQNIAWTAARVKEYMDIVHARHPETQIGLIEPYPHESADAIMSAILEMEHLGVRLPFFQLDFDFFAGERNKEHYIADIRRIREFCRAKGIRFGVIIWGADGRSNEAYFADAWGSFLTVYAAVGLTEITKFQSWAESEPTNLNSRKFAPDVLPETNPNRHTGFLLRVLDYIRTNGK